MAIAHWLGVALAEKELIMTVNTLSRRNLLRAGTCALVGASGVVSSTSVLAEQNRADAEPGGTAVKEQLIRTYYSGYEKKDWNVSGGVLSDSFTFTSPNNDDHISKSVFKERCFLSQLDFIKQFELEMILARGDEAFVKYICRTTKGTSFRNVEYFHFADGKITAIEAYFGGNLGYPAASASGKP
jgi:ketosteroid isomerase-like protein